MNFSNNFIEQEKTSTGINTSEFIPARVVDIILDESHPEWNKFGGPSALGAVKYKVLGLSIDTETLEDVKALPIAFPQHSSIKNLPLKNEIILIQSSTDNLQASSRETFKISYYTTILSIWNHPHHNALPEKGVTEVDLGKDIPELTTVNPKQPFPGDLLIESRLGTSLRFSGYKHSSNIFTDDDNNGSPFLIFTNGQATQDNSFTPIVEDINKDLTSLYVLSNHTAPLVQVRSKADTHKIKPVKADTYKGNQVIVNSGRLFFNAKEESILFSSKEAFSATSKTINLDGEDYIGLDAKKIYLGKNALTFESQPIILGDSLEVFMHTLLTELSALADVLSKAKTIDQKPLPSVNLRGVITKAVIEGLKKQINPGGGSTLKSKKVFSD